MEFLKVKFGFLYDDVRIGGIIKDSKTWKTMDEAVGQVLDLQRKRIRNLEQEYDSLYEKYEEILRSKF